MATRRQRWPKNATAAADEIAIALADIRKQAGAIGRMAASRDMMADTALDLLKANDLITLERQLLDMRMVASAQALAAVQIEGVAGMASVVLAAARRGEY
jgi:hypothetical protein